MWEPFTSYVKYFRRERIPIENQSVYQTIILKTYLFVHVLKKSCLKFQKLIWLFRIRQVFIFYKLMNLTILTCNHSIWGAEVIITFDTVFHINCFSYFDWRYLRTVLCAYVILHVFYIHSCWFNQTFQCMIQIILCPIS